MKVAGVEGEPSCFLKAPSLTVALANHVSDHFTAVALDHRANRNPEIAPPFVVHWLVTDVPTDPDNRVHLLCSGFGVGWSVSSVPGDHPRQTAREARFRLLPRVPVRSKILQRVCGKLDN